MCADHDPNRLMDLLEWDSHTHGTLLHGQKRFDSSIFGITSTIGPLLYKGKRGKTLGHYYPNGQLIKEAKEGDKPMSYDIYINLCKELFELDMDKLDDIVGEYMDGTELWKIDMTTLFKLKSVIPPEYMGNNGLIATNQYYRN